MLVQKLFEEFRAKKMLVKKKLLLVGNIWVAVNIH